ncbi:ABC transporter permease [Salinigranum halophilum]|uniref:ABC transporter permease n=1 Tax=Salinigranum halophilum TaxID=2565931 RepID=UPI0010A7D8D2|nr:ABC transporter permease [Salinigranum halophilum]
MAQTATHRTLGWLLRAVVVSVYLALFVPIVVMVLYSFDGSPIPIYPLNDLTLRWYTDLFGPYYSDFIQPLLNSLYVAFLTSVVATTLGGLGGFAISRYDFYGSSVYPFVLATPAMVPPLISAFGLFAFLQQTLGLEMSVYTTVVGHVALTLPFAAFIIAGKLGPEEELERAARDLGAGYVQMIREVTIPVLGPALVASLLLTFTISFGESAMVFLLSGSKTLLPVALSERFAAGVSPRYNAVSTIVILITFGLFTLAELVRQNVGE